MTRTTNNEQQEAKKEMDVHKTTVIIAIVTYSICSSMLLLVNQIAVSYYPCAAMIITIQFTSQTLVCLCLKYTCVPEIDNIEWKKVKAYSLYVLLFVAYVYSTMRCLEEFSIDTVIAFRSCTPLFVACVEYAFLDREFPNIKSITSMFVIFTAACLYGVSDFSEFNFGSFNESFFAFLWVFVSLFSATIQDVYTKVLTYQVPMRSIWSAVLYVSLLSIFPIIMIGATEGNYVTCIELLPYVDMWGLFAIAISCCLSALAGFTCWRCNRLVSATTFSVICVTNKLLTIFASLLWNSDVSVLSIVAVVLMSVGGAFYEEAPIRRQLNIIVEDQSVIANETTPLKSHRYEELPS